MTPQDVHFHDEVSALLRDYLDAFHVDADERMSRRALLAAIGFLKHPVTLSEADAALFRVKVAVLEDRVR